MVETVLVMCPEVHDSFANEFNPSLSLAYLKPAFEEKGVSVECLDPFNDRDLHQKGLEGIIRRIKETDPNAVGISAVSNIWDSFLTVVSRIKAATGKPIVAGGYISTVPEIMKMTDAIDILFLGEGELRGPEVFKAFRPVNVGRKDQMLHDIPGLIFRGYDGEIQETGATPFTTDIDGFQPNFAEVIRGEVAYLYASRGCYARCSFCDIRDQIGTGVRRMSRDKLSDVIEALAKEFGVKVVHFYDDDFLHSREEPGRIDEIASTLRSYGVSIEFQTRAQDIIRRRDELERNRDVISYVQVGAESFVERQLLEWRKGIKPSDNMKSFNILSSLRISYRALLIMLDGRTTPKEMQENIEHVLQLPQNGGIPYTVTAFSSQYLHGHPLKDKWGKHDLTTSGQRRFADLIAGSTGLKMWQEYEETFRREKLFSGIDGDGTSVATDLMQMYRTIATVASYALFVSAAEAIHESQRGELAEKRHKRLGHYMKRLETDGKVLEEDRGDASLFVEDLASYRTNITRAYHLSREILQDAASLGWKLPSEI